MQFSDELKGRLTEAAIACTLRHAGYPVISPAIENIFAVLPLLDQSTYCQLELGRLRQLPDLIALRSPSPALQLDVKFRSTWTRSTVQYLLEKLRHQQEFFPDTHTILARGSSPRGDAARADDLIRVLPPRRLELLAASDIFFHAVDPTGNASEEARLEPTWAALQPVTTAFERLRGEQRGMLEQLAPLFLTLGRL